LYVKVKVKVKVKLKAKFTWPGVDSASNRNEYQEHFVGVKAAGA
jgi:hypothetical protein